MFLFSTFLTNIFIRQCRCPCFDGLISSVSKSFELGYPCFVVFISQFLRVSNVVIHLFVNFKESLNVVIQVRRIAGLAILSRDGDGGGGSRA